MAEYEPLCYVKDKRKARRDTLIRVLKLLNQTKMELEALDVSDPFKPLQMEDEWYYDKYARSSINGMIKITAKELGKLVKG